MITEEQKQERINYLGGTDCAAALGLSEWKSQLGLWTEKTGMLAPENIDHKINVRLGNKLEDAVAQLFEEETGKKVMRRNYTIYHPVYPFLAANLDRIVVGEDANLECKTVSAWRAAEFKDNKFPQDMLRQCHHGLAVTDKNMCYLAVLIGNADFKWTIVFRDKEIEAKIIQKEVDFWNNFVIPKIMPMSITSDDGSTLYKLFPISDPNKDIILDDNATSLIEVLEANQAELIALENQIEESKNKLKAMLGEAESAQAGKYRVTWKEQYSKRIDVDRLKKEQDVIYSAYLKESKTRVLRYSQKDKK